RRHTRFARDWSSDVCSSDLQDEDWPRLTSALNLLSQAKLFIDDTPALAPTEMRARARRLKREHGLGLIVVDYLQLMQVPGFKEKIGRASGRARVETGGERVA